MTNYSRVLPWILLAAVGPAREPKVTRLDMVFVVVGDPTSGRAELTTRDYEPVLRRAAVTLERETLGRMQLGYTIVELPLGEGGYAARTFLEWHDDLALALSGAQFDVLAFGPDRRTPWCTDAHSLGLVVEGARFTCLEAPTPVPLAANLLIHKIFHTYGFFHQELRNKQYRLLDWELGLPGYTETADVVTAEDARREVEAMSFFSPMALSAITSGTLRCDGPADAREECRDLHGPFDRDVDGDGIRDDVDGYPVSPPRGGEDSDHDGIPDALDLCPGTDVEVKGDVAGGPMIYRAVAPRVDLSVAFAGAPLSVRWVAASVDTGKRLGDLMYFDTSRETVGNSLTLPPATPVRVRVAYTYRGQSVRRSFYVVGEQSRTTPGPWAYFDEKEWFYFGRFGCDPPAGLDLYDPSTYDANADGLPDGLAIPATYDWDGDGIPDREDTLPTVAGHCANAHVRGVKDTDGDGFCDPGRLYFGALPADVDRRTYFGEIPTEMGNDPDADRCPYLAGPDHGCPLRSDGKPWYAD